ncbi:RNA methyltransferase, RsmD family [Peptostreptococcaceae bacterium oral taxon 113 str. W5053]|nr:RNA methyltransferase, RsmD family [Peptostreptococcaceae bacterium oral taxon 113 str. W5053]
MRIIAGERRGMVLFGAKDKTIRPTMDQAKEALFNILSPISSTATVLDLFGGTGAIALEFLSRGAKFAVIGELRRKNVEIIKMNIKKTRYEDKSRLELGDYRKILKKVSMDKLQFDYIFLDPPYHTDLAKNTLCEIKKYDILSKSGIIIIETANDENLQYDVDIFNLIDIRLYGQTKFYFLSSGDSYEGYLSR